jgi:hypothetical protein
MVTPSATAMRLLLVTPRSMPMLRLMLRSIPRHPREREHERAAGGVRGR